MKKIVGNNQDFFFCLYPKLSSYGMQKVLDVHKERVVVVPDKFFMLSIQDIIDVRN